MLGAFDITMKKVTGQDLSQEENDFLKTYNAKFALVKYLYTEKMRAKGLDLKQFSFTPGDKFNDTPTIDIVNSLLSINLLDCEPYDFGDSSHEPPVTAKEKRELS